MKAMIKCLYRQVILTPSSWSHLLCIMSARLYISILTCFSMVMSNFEKLKKKHLWNKWINKFKRHNIDSYKTSMYQQYTPLSLFSMELEETQSHWNSKQTLFCGNTRWYPPWMNYFILCINIVHCYPVYASLHICLCLNFKETWIYLCVILSKLVDY